MRLLLLNPNASAHITARMAASARRALSGRDELVEVTNAHGPAAVRDARTLSQAMAGVPALLAQHLPRCDALVLGISLDGQIDQLRAACDGKPALGMTEAAIAMAARSVRRIGLITLGHDLAPLYGQLMAARLPPERDAGVLTTEVDSAFAAGPALDAHLLAALISAASKRPADGYVLGGAVLCGYDAALQAELGRPVFDGVYCAVRWMQEIACASPGRTPASHPPSARDARSRPPAVTPRR